nr:MAG TPA: hypothetical protein [Caudoviricetes sp.]
MTYNKGKALERLISNPDFKEVILEGYLKEYPLSLLHTDTTANKHVYLDAVSFFKQYLDTVEEDAKAAYETLVDNTEN